jgi:hypothetical protein
MLVVVGAFKQGLASLWQVAPTFPQLMWFFTNGYKSPGTIGSYFDQFLDLSTTQATGLRPNHPRHSIELFSTAT